MTKDCVFQAWRNLSLRCVADYKPGPVSRFPVGSGPDPKARRKQTRLLIVATSSDRLFLSGLLASIARLRFTGTRNLTCLFLSLRQKGTFLLCQLGGHSYFALTAFTRRLTLPCPVHKLGASIEGG
jgi:hypothetical protein